MDQGLSRRHFIITSVTAAGGFALAIAAPGTAKALSLAAQPWGKSETPDPNEINAWIVIEPDDRVIIRYARAEMGQGSFTALPMIVAEELECDWSKVSAEYASPNRNLREKQVYKAMGTGGSRAVRDSHGYLQQAGASARARLVRAAAQRWGVADADCSAEQSRVLHKPSGRSLRYGEIAQEAAKISLEKEPAIKTPDQFKLLGKWTPRFDTPLKINGSAVYGIDVKIPGMVYAAIQACPVFGGTLASVEDSAIAGRRGILQVVKLGNAVAVLADSYWRAKQGLEALSIRWNEGAGAGSDSKTFAAAYRAALDDKGFVARNEGDVDQALPKAAKLIDAVYEVPHLSHAPMEPLNCTAHVQADRVDVWLGTQNAEGALQLAAQAAGIAPEKVYVHNAFVGGGFGRRLRNDELVQAVQVSKIAGKPVKLIWSREEDMRQDRYRPQAAIRFKAGLGADGMPVAFDCKTVCGSSAPERYPNGFDPQTTEGLVSTSYAIPNLRVTSVMKNTHVPLGPWRAPGHSQNAFFIESFVDEMANAAGKNPLQFRRALLQHRADFLHVLDVLEEKSGWGKPMPAGKGRGIAIHEAYDSITGIVAEVAVSDKGEVKVERVTVAVDCGHVVNPNGVESQMAGGVIYGLTATLYGAITIKDGRVEQGNFDSYPMMRMKDAPAIAVHLALTGGKKWGGVGEPSTAVIPAAVTNAIFAATGKRVRSLPLLGQTLAGAA